MRDSMFDDVAARTSLAPAVRTNGTVNGVAADKDGDGNHYRVAMLVVSGGAITDGTHTVTLQHSDDGVSWANVPPGDRQSAAASSTVQVTTNTTTRIGYIGSRRYLRAVAETTSATVGGAFSAVILMSQGNGGQVS